MGQTQNQFVKFLVGTLNFDHIDFYIYDVTTLSFFTSFQQWKHNYTNIGFCTSETLLLEISFIKKTNMCFSLPKLSSEGLV